MLMENVCQLGVKGWDKKFISKKYKNLGVWAMKGISCKTTTALARGQTERSTFTGVMSIKERILKRPIEVLEYYRREKILPAMNSILGR